MVWVNVRSKGRFLGGLHNIPGFPEISNNLWKRTGEKLQGRKDQYASARNGCTREYTLGVGKDRTKRKAKDWLFTGNDKLGSFSLEEPKQFMISWTTYQNECEPGADDRLADEFARELTDSEAATRAFWPRIAKFGTGYNLLGILRKVTAERLPQLEVLFSEAEAPFGPGLPARIPAPPSAWQPRFESLQKEGRLFEIDLSLFGQLGPNVYGAGEGRGLRFNPGTLTLLEMTDKKDLLPVLIRVTSDFPVIESPGPGGYRVIAGVQPGTPPRWQIYSAETSTPGAWLYALQAAKTSVTLYGIWLGHVYHWHLTTAAMVRTMKEAMRDRNHPVIRLLYLHSDYLIEFNYFLLAGPAPNVFHDPYLEIAPPTALVTEEQVLWLEDKFAEGRNFFDDDPKIELANNGLVEADFTEKKAWDRFPAAQNLLRIWDICETFVKAFVSNSYRDDAAVAADKGLQKWMENAAKPDQGNIRGLPQLKDCDALIRLLTSQLYRLTAHGASRLPRSTDPWLTFVANFPPCLQRMEFPAPDVDLGTQELLKYLPNLKTIAGMMGFYYAFAYSKPYTSMIPGGGTDRDLDFPGGAADPRNKALIQYRNSIKQFIGDYTKAQLPPGYHSSSDPEPWLQWPMNIET